MSTEAMTAAKTVRCQRCRRRLRNAAGWNVIHIAGLEVGYLCPGCQTAEEDAEAAVNEVLVDYSTWTTLSQVANTAEDRTRVVVETLIRSYPTPEVLRHKANQLGPPAKTRPRKRWSA